MNSETEQKKTLRHGTRAMFLLLLALVLTATATLAWFLNMHRLQSVSLVGIPSKITISGSKRSELTKISLDMTENDSRENNTITVRRVFCIESTADFLLEVAHTTNLPDMTIEIYPVSVANSELASTATGAVSAGSGSNLSYYVPDATTLNGGYLNEESSETIADSTYHDFTYSDDSGNTKVQENAEPLYWRTTSAEEFNRAGYARSGKSSDDLMSISYRYYVLELSWSAETQETDLVYLMASYPEAD